MKKQRKSKIIKPDNKKLGLGIRILIEDVKKKLDKLESEVVEIEHAKIK